MSLKTISFLLAASCASVSFANNFSESLPDSSRVIDIEEAVVVASPKETSNLRRQPMSVSLFGKSDLQVRDVDAIKGLSVAAPNFFMPDYGSRITSAVYIRGIGSRMNTPAVGVYIDNVPLVDKSSYDFSFLDVVRVDVLRGPQATLYGRNTMGGLIRVFTADPLPTYAAKPNKVYQGTELQLGASGRNSGRKASFSTQLRPSEKFGLSFSGYYDGEDGFFYNKATGEHADGAEAGGGRIKLAWKPTDVFRADLTASYEYSDEDACPYFLADGSPESGIIAQNRPSTYRRGVLNTGLGLEWRLPKLTLSSITSYQNLNDRLFMDQDFTTADIFSLTQKQHIQTVTEEVSLKSRGQGRWQWTSGAFFMYQNLKTDCPVSFYQDGVGFLNDQLASVLPQQQPPMLSFTGTGIPFIADLRTPSLNAALFHQSTVKLGAGLSAIVGLRLDYDYRELHLKSGTSAPIGYNFQMPSFRINNDFQSTPELNGNLYDDSWQLLPKFALQYDHKRGRGNVYASVSKGYRSGGYNIQAYSDLSQTMLRRTMMTDVKDFCVETINRMPLPEASKEAAINGMTGVLNKNIPAEPQISDLAYKPEESWNYELGGHLNFCKGALQFDYTFFLMDTHNQQLARFSDSGMGRIMVNAGKSRSYGVELAARGALLNNRLTLSAGYGYTHAAFTNYDLGTSNDQPVDYTGNRVPFVPEHTVNMVVAYRQPLSCKAIKALGISADFSGAGRIWWDEANSFSQNFYALLGARLSAEFAGNIHLALWGKNLTQTDYNTFCFESMGRRFAQQGVPVHFGADINIRF